MVSAKLTLRPGLKRDDCASCPCALISFCFRHVRPALAVGRQDRGSATGWDPRLPGADDKCRPTSKDQSKGKRKDSLLASPSCLYSFPRQEWHQGYNTAQKWGRGCSTARERQHLTGSAAWATLRRSSTKADTMLALRGGSGKEWGKKKPKTEAFMKERWIPGRRLSNESRPR